MSNEPILASNSQFRCTGNDAVEQDSHGRRELKLSIGPMHVQVVEIPSDELIAEEWRTIQTARDSYALIWGKGNGCIEDVKEDPFDGRDLRGAPYKVWHYIATVKSAKEEDKILTMRKLYYPLQKYHEIDKMNPEEVLNWIEDYLPDDISFWEIVNYRNNRVHSLWKELRARMRSNGLFDFSTFSRSGIIPYVVTEKDERTKEKSGIAFATIQLLAVNGHTGDFIFGQQCEEFPKKVLRIVNKNGKEVVLDFSPAAQTLGLTAKQTLRLNREQPDVIKHLVNFPGYWIDNTLAASTVTRLVKEGKVSKDQIRAAWERLRLDALNKEEVMRKLLKDIQNELEIRSESDLPVDIENLEENIIALLTKPRYFKYMVPLEENSALYYGLVYESGDGPYPTALIPQAWEKSAKNLLSKAQEKYTKETVGLRGKNF